MKNTPPGMEDDCKAWLLRHDGPNFPQQTLPHQAAPQNVALRDRHKTPIKPLGGSPVIIYRANKEPTGAVVTVSGRPSQTNEGRWLLADGIECEG